MALAILCGAPAIAGDSALPELIGYSGDFRYFAFEQYGIQDGSGFPYAEIFLLDLATDRFVGGAPFEARIDDEGADLIEARALARTRASAALADHDITEPARFLAVLGDGEWGAGDTRLSFGMPVYGLGDPEGTYEISLDLFRSQSDMACEEWFGEAPMGFALYLDDGSGREEMHRDTRVPQSRHCVITYKAYGAVMPLHSRDIGNAVALVSVHAHGFEGADRRFIAFPLGRAD